MTSEWDSDIVMGNGNLFRTRFYGTSKNPNGLWKLIYRLDRDTGQVEVLYKQRDVVSVGKRFGSFNELRQALDMVVEE